MTRLDVLPERTAGAAENMALDFLLLRRYPDPKRARFRHYGWRAPAFTFGYGQKIGLVRSLLSSEAPPFELCRRPTGGGIVDHRADWTYALVIPRGHPLEEARATASYRAVHACLAQALRDQGVPASLQEPAEAATPASVAAAAACFERAEAFDVVNAASGAKIAGAAQKRTKEGILFQGSAWRPAAGAGVDWGRLLESLVLGICAASALEAAEAPWPEFAEDEAEGLIERYASPEWLEFR